MYVTDGSDSMPPHYRNGRADRGWKTTLDDTPVQFAVCTPSNSYTPHSPRQTEPDTGAERSGDQGRERRPRFARLIGSVTYVVIAVSTFAALERCSANQINKWRRRRRKKSEKTDCGKGAIIGDAISIDSPLVHALRCMRLPQHDEGAEAGEIEGRVPQKRSRRRQILFSRAISCGDGDGEKGAAIIAAAMTGEGEGSRKEEGAERSRNVHRRVGSLPPSPMQPGAVQSVAADQGG